MRYAALIRARVWHGVLLAIVIVLFTSISAAAAITNGYATQDTALVPGMVASLSTGSQSSSQSYVERAYRDNQERVIGVATTLGDSLVSFTSRAAQVYVENQGEVQTYVSDINGDIKKGDLLTTSPLKGMLMKVGQDGYAVIGVAAEDFRADQAESHQVEGNTKAALIEKIRVNLDQRGLNGNAEAQDNMLKKLGRALTGKNVGEVRVLISLVIFLLVMLAEGSILYGSITSAISSVGRNPLARRYIFRELGRVVMIVMVVLVFGLAAIYAILWT